MSDIMNNTPIDKDRLKKELSFGKRAVSITSGITTGTPVKRFNDMNTPIEKRRIDFKWQDEFLKRFPTLRVYPSDSNELERFCDSEIFEFISKLVFEVSSQSYRIGYADGYTSEENDHILKENSNPTISFNSN